MNVAKLGLLLLSVPVVAAAQQHDATPADKLKMFEGFTGDWHGKQNFNVPGGPAMVGDAVDHIALAVGGRYLEERLSTTLPGRKPSDTRHFMTYDPKTEKYRAWWFNDTSVDPTVLEGTMNGDSLVLESVPGSGSHLRATYQHESATQFTWTLEAKRGDDWMKLFSTTYSKA